MAKPRFHIFTVEGKGHFPFDMLRYDSCWPSTSEDVSKLTFRDMAAKLDDNLRLFQTTVRKIELISATKPTDGRWITFGWRVTYVRPIL